ncbi:hypothetical protein GCM10009546_59060 [Actinomadura livida]|uniref:Uncharacterized protein n=1 Tax=Actinomadura livida TaxID=79909 RepID=A0ABN1FE20_9ACTN|nr:hypothetical protein GCM10010208_61360 [Actinomadura livida]
MGIAQTGRHRGQTFPVEPPLTASRVALAAGDPAQTTVYFRNGTFVPAGRRDEQAAIDFATARLAAPRDLRDFRATPTDGGGRLVAFDDVTVWLSPDEIKHSGTIDLGRQAAAKISPNRPATTGGPTSHGRAPTSPERSAAHPSASCANTSSTRTAPLETGEHLIAREAIRPPLSRSAGGSASPPP